MQRPPLQMAMPTEKPDSCVFFMSLCLTELLSTFKDDLWTMSKGFLQHFAGSFAHLVGCCGAMASFRSFRTKINVQAKFTVTNPRWDLTEAQFQEAVNQKLMFTFFDRLGMVVGNLDQKMHGHRQVAEALLESAPTTGKKQKQK